MPRFVADRITFCKGINKFTTLQHNNTVNIFLQVVTIISRLHWAYLKNIAVPTDDIPVLLLYANFTHIFPLLAGLR